MKEWLIGFCIIFGGFALIGTGCWLFEKDWFKALFAFVFFFYILPKACGMWICEFGCRP